MLGAVLAVFVFAICLLYTKSAFLQIALLAYEILLIFSLVFVVLHMRSTIKKTKIAFPNEKLVSLHLIIFAIWVPIFAV